MDTYTNLELLEMGLPLPCECLSTYREYGDRDEVYDVCVDCGASALAGRRAVAWTW